MDDHVSLNEFCRRYRVSYHTGRKWLDSGAIPSFQPPGSRWPLIPYQEAIERLRSFDVTPPVEEDDSAWAARAVSSHGKRKTA